jgi:tRNA-splicing ligase RtcB
VAQKFTGTIERISECCWKIPKEYQSGMRVDGIVYANAKLMKAIQADDSLQQVANVAFLPGICKASLAMPDIHLGYGFCIGGVAATDPKRDGVISPGGVGYDINCGVRLIRSDLTIDDVRPRIDDLVNQLFRDVPCGVGMDGQFEFKRPDLERILREGPAWLVRKKEIGTEQDIHFTEAGGSLDGADPDCVSDRAFARGRRQCGTLGSGNHFLEVQVVDRILDREAADSYGLAEGQIAVMIHSGSRGLGYQVCDDYLDILGRDSSKFGIKLPDRQLACAPIESDVGQRYLKAMRSAANFAWANRHLMMHLTRKAFERVFGKSWESLGMRMVYDVAHNIAKFEDHDLGDRRATVCVHRKGATRAFPPGHPEIPPEYREVGQPVMIPGDMGRYSFVLAGRDGAMSETFGSTCHGAGRRMSRKAAVRDAAGRSILKELKERGVTARARSKRGLAEEQSAAYKNVEDVTSVVEQAGLSSRVCRLRPIGVIKG